MTTATYQPTCPKCQGTAMYDNRAENDQRLQRGEKLRPDWKCKALGCEGVIWRGKGGNGAQKPAPAPAPAPASFGHIPGLEDPYARTLAPVQPVAVDEFRTLCAKYAECVEYVLGAIVPHLVRAQVGASPESVSAMAATIFIARKDAGV